MRILREVFACLFEWHVEPSSPKELEALNARRVKRVSIAQAFGVRPGNTPGESNRALAKVVWHLMYEHNIAAVVQWEVNDASADITTHGRVANHVIYKHREPERYLDTWEVLEQAAGFCRDANITHVLIVAHPDHVWRVRAHARQLGLTTLIADTRDVPYDWQSAQWWTRSRTLWMLREIPTRLWFLWQGKLKI